MSGLGQLGPLFDLARPSSLRRLGRAGVLGPRNAVALARTVPWLLGRGPSLGILTALHARARGAEPAIHDRHGTLTWRDLERRTNRAARAMGSLGVGPGGRVATLLRNGREALEVLVAAQKLGAEAYPLNTWSSGAEVGTLLEIARPRVLVYDARHGEDLQGIELPPTVVVGGPPNGPPDSEPYEELLEDNADGPLPPLTRRRGAPRVVIHTSGTTGRPKGAARDAGGRGLRGFAGLLDAVPLRTDDVILCPAPLFHSFGLLVATMALLLGSTVVLPDRFDPGETLELLERHRATVCALVPVMIRRIVALPPEARDGRDRSTLRMLVASGAAIPQDLRDEVASVFGDVLHDLYGSTEAGWVAVATPVDMARRPGTVGRPVEGVEVAALGPDGERMPPGEVGELHVRSEALFEGYTTGEDAPAREGYLSLGDLGRVDEEGYLYVEGRGDDMTVVGGENVFPEEVEAVIRRVEGVEDVAVVGVPDPEYGQVLAAFVVGDAEEAAVLDACRADLASFKVPRRVERIHELPRTATGKVLRRRLADPEQS